MPSPRCPERFPALHRPGLLLGLTILILAAATLLATPYGLDPGPLTWSHLRFEASKLFLKAETTVDLSKVDRQAAVAKLLAPGGEQPFEQAGAETFLLRLDSSFAGRHSTSRVWLDPRRGLVLQRLKQRFGKKAYQKIYRFGNDGVFSERRSPRSQAEATGDATGWTGVSETFYPTSDDCVRIVEPESMLYWTSASQLHRGQTVRFCAFSNKTFVPTELSAGETSELEVDYTLRTGGGTRAMRGKTEVLKLTLSPLPSSTAEEEETLELLGLEGEVEIYLDTTRRLPVQVSGRLPGLGRIDIKLREAVLR